MIHRRSLLSGQTWEAFAISLMGEAHQEVGASELTMSEEGASGFSVHREREFCGTIRAGGPGGVP